MNKLKFEGAAVAKLLAHAIESNKHEATYEQAYQLLGKAWFDGRVSAETLRDRIEAGLHLVHDQGIYLMSNGFPRLEGDGRVVYAQGCEPNNERNPEWHEHCCALVGGDDFVEHVPAAMLRQLGRNGDSKNQTVEIGISETRFMVTIKTKGGK